MANDTLGRYATAFGLSLAVTNIFSALLVVVKESFQDSVLALMKSFGHHWVTHGVLNLIVFVALGLVLAQAGGGKGPRVSGKAVTGLIVLSVLLGALIIIAFYGFE